MKRKSIKYIFIFIFAIIYIGRVVSLNFDFPISQNKYYKIGESVPIENDFFDMKDEMLNGYSLKVVNTTLMSMDEFFLQYGEFENEYNKDENYVLLLKVIFANSDNNLGTSVGIDLGKYILQENDYINLVEQNFFKYINDFTSIKFALKEYSEKEFIVPFIINSNSVDIERIKNGCPTLVVSLFPNKKIIELSN